MKFLPDIKKIIKSVKDLSDPFIKRLRVSFPNGYELSIIYGYGTYSDKDKKLYEIACFANGRMTDKFWSDNGDDVLGYVPEEKVIEYIKIIAGAYPCPVEVE